MTQDFQIDRLLSRLRKAWTDLNVSAEVYADAIKAARRKPIHHNTLRRLEDKSWSPSVEILRDLELHLILDPISTTGLPKRVDRRPRRKTPGFSVPGASRASIPGPIITGSCD